MRILILLITLVSCATSEFERFRHDLSGKSPEEKGEFTQKFIASHHFPLKDKDGWVTFLYRHERNEEVRLTGDFFRMPGSHKWDLHGLPMEPLEVHSPWSFHSVRISSKAAVEYVFLIDGIRRRDELNPVYTFNGVAETKASVAEMPKFSPPRPFATATAKGTIKDILGTFATPVRVYLPPDFDQNKRYPVIYTTDGEAWIKYIGLPDILDQGISTGEIRPTIAVMIDATADRSDWYSFDPRYLANFENVVKYVDEHWPTLREAGERYLLSSSAGGRAVLYTLLSRPDLAMNSVLFSPSLMKEHTFYRPWSGGHRKIPRMKLWMSAGSFEGKIFEDTKEAAELLKLGGADVRTMFTEEGHSFRAWRQKTPEALRHFLKRRDL